MPDSNGSERGILENDMIFATLDVDIFDDPSITELMDIDEVYFAMLIRCVCLAKKANMGGAILCDGTPFSAASLARIHHGRGQQFLSLWETFLGHCVDFGLLALSNGTWFVLNWRKWHRKPSDESGKISERVARHRSNKGYTDISSETVTPCNAPVTPCNAPVTPCNAVKRHVTPSNDPVTPVTPQSRAEQSKAETEHEQSRHKNGQSPSARFPPEEFEPLHIGEKPPLTQIPWLAKFRNAEQANAEACGQIEATFCRAFPIGGPSQKDLKRLAGLTASIPQNPSHMPARDWIRLFVEAASEAVDAAISQQKPRFALSNVESAWNSLAAEEK